MNARIPASIASSLTAAAAAAAAAAAIWALDLNKIESRDDYSIVGLYER